MLNIGGIYRRAECSSMNKVYSCISDLDFSSNWGITVQFLRIPVYDNLPRKKTWDVILKWLVKNVAGFLEFTVQYLNTQLICFTVIF